MLIAGLGIGSLSVLLTRNRKCTSALSTDAINIGLGHFNFIILYFFPHFMLRSQIHNESQNIKLNESGSHFMETLEVSYLRENLLEILHSRQIYTDKNVEIAIRRVMLDSD
jgi:hypothetical protein